MDLQKKWFVYLDDHHEGPFSPDEIFQKQKSGNLSHESYVWCEGMTDWQVMDQVLELRMALQQFKETAPAPKPKAPNPSLSPPTAFEKPNESRVDSLPEKKARRSSSALKFLVLGILAVTVLGLGGLAAVSRSASEDTHALIRPTLMKLIDRLPILAPLFQLTPKIADLKPEESLELQDAMTGRPEDGVRFAAAVSHGDPNRPYFYVATNLPDRTKFDLYLVGNSDTLLNRLNFSAQTTVTTRFGLGHSEVILAVGGQPMPKGEYEVFAVESAEQEESVRDVFNRIPPSRTQIKTPTEIPSGTKFIFAKAFFIGGERDETYLTRLRAFHDKVKQSADREVQELKQYTDTLQMQLSSLSDDFGRIYKSKKVTPQLKIAWAKTSTTWQQINGQMDQTIQTWTKETLQNEFFYGKTYEMVKGVHESLQKLFTVESSFINQPSDRSGFEIEHGKAMSEATGAMAQLKARVDQILKSPKTASGLPTREE